MDSEMIHSYKQSKMESLRIVLLMVPVIAFIAVLFLFWKFSGSTGEMATSTSSTAVLGTHE